ncbi:nucleotidyltransferase domain-containing protein [Lysobacter gummosus]|uniref:Nucleotidyltransferase domain-containing protein n=1 Tax=Lysobacter gummosus TaxID=262324 RepID=A0ABY3XCR7_9GAMM|nr:nucleotidyltransferase domain-containing protein [Lysobacter gummosus]ALN94134.1 putative nucleotidyltransferase family protein [Lysobacter gummosus]UNP29550.1 nucleotidyltransferase domain-containing protein [Lysobacter gummosus]
MSDPAHPHDIHPVSDAKRRAVLVALAAIEREHEVRIVYACESGSRGWGFSSPDSDYDARFVYVHKQPWYLTVNERTGAGEPQRDVIELPIDDELDVSGWDLRKTLRLLSKSNPTLSEWLRSPIVYRQDDALTAQLRDLADAFYSPIAAWHHYLSMAKGNFRGYLRGEQVRTKKYLYVLRPVLACQWIECEAGAPPMAFEDLLERLLPHGLVREAIDALLVRKRLSAEVAAGPRIAAISDFLEAEIERMQALQPQLPAGAGRGERLDEFFRSALA